MIPVSLHFQLNMDLIGKPFPLTQRACRLLYNLSFPLVLALVLHHDADIKEHHTHQNYSRCDPTCFDESALTRPQVTRIIMLEPQGCY